MTYTAKGMSIAIGQMVSIRMENLLINAEVIDAKAAYGRPRLLVRPLSGFGEQWVELSRVSKIAERGTVKIITGQQITS
jgi:hypothetical protein